MFNALIKEGVTDHEGAVHDIMGVLLAGSDTTARCLTQIFWRLKQHPDIFKRLKTEIDEMIPTDCTTDNLAEFLTSENIDEMPFLLSFVKECLRT